MSLHLPEKALEAAMQVYLAGRKSSAGALPGHRTRARIKAVLSAACDPALKEQRLVSVPEILSILRSDECYYAVADGSQTWWTAITEATDYLEKQLTS